jgi:hypothetical protein
MVWFRNGWHSGSVLIFLWAMPQPTKQFIRALKRWPGPFSQHDGLAPNRRGQP